MAQIVPARALPAKRRTPPTHRRVELTPWQQAVQGREKLEAISSDWDKQSDNAMHSHHQWALAMTAIQIAIALAAITLLTRKSWLEYAVYGVAVVGLLLGLGAWFHIDPLAGLSASSHPVTTSPH